MDKGKVMAYTDYINYALDPLGRPRFFGVYSGVVTNNVDPNNVNRLSICVPQVTGEESLDLVPGCFPPILSGYIVLPNVGDKVWVIFESGDLSYPVWMGVFTPQDGTVAALTVVDGGVV